MADREDLKSRSLDPATREMIARAAKMEVRTVWDRYDAMQPQCGFGDLGLCCRHCLQGPCRIDPFGEGPREGICGATADTMVARGLDRAIAAGTAAHYGARLRDCGEEVTFIARGAHLDALRSVGLRVRHPEWQFDRPVRACSLEDFLEKFSPSEADLIILCVKAMHTESIARRIAEWMGDGSLPVLSLQNGVDNEIILAGQLGAQRVLGGLAVRIGSHLGSPGVIDAVGPGQVVMGQWPKESSHNTELLGRLVGIFNGAGIPTRVSGNIQLELWRKLIINNGVNPLSALTRLDTGALTRDPGLSRIVYAMMSEASVAAAADGVVLTEADCREMFELICGFDPIKTSMLVDLEHNRPLELEEICGAVLARSEQLHREAPFTFTIYQLLRLATSRAS